MRPIAIPLLRSHRERGAQQLMIRRFQVGTLIVGLILVGDASAQQPRSTSEPPISRVAYARDSGPVVAIDEAHQNTHTSGGAFLGLARLLQRDGFRVRPFPESISRRSLEGIDILVIAQPGGWQGASAAPGAAEVEALIDWVRRGGSLLLILDHSPGPAGGRAIAEALGIDHWHDGYAAVEAQDSPVYTIRYQRSGRQGEESVFQTRAGGRAWQGPDALILDHVITAGRAADERVNSVMTFGGSAFRPPPGAEGLLVLPNRAISLVPQASADPGGPGTSRIDVGGWLAGAALQLEAGRIALFAETGMFSAQWPVHAAAADNYKFVLNVVRWLGRVL